MEILSLYKIVFNITKAGLSNGLIRFQKGIPKKGVVHVHDRMGMDFIIKVITDFPPNAVNEEIAEALCVSVSNMRSVNGLEWIGHLLHNDEPLVYYVRSILLKNKIDRVISDEQQALLNGIL